MNYYKTSLIIYFVGMMVGGSIVSLDGWWPLIPISSGAIFSVLYHNRYIDNGEKK